MRLKLDWKSKSLKIDGIQSTVIYSCSRAKNLIFTWLVIEPVYWILCYWLSENWKHVIEVSLAFFYCIIFYLSL